MSDTTVPTKEQALELMKLSMPPFEQFLEHCSALKSECEKAGALTPERIALFDQYKDALLAQRSTYEDAIAELICQSMTTEEVQLLHTFFTGPMFQALQKAQDLGGQVADIGMTWQTQTLESCKETWQMIVENVGEWQMKNMPGTQVNLPDAPGDASQWKRIDATAQASEYIPAGTTDEPPPTA